MKFLHTSDWHLGRSLYGRKRYAEFEQFLTWLLEKIEAENVDALLVAGDIFDTGLPSNRSQELYYQFLAKISTSNCQHVVIIAGNHDSPTFLKAPQNILKALNVHVIALATDINLIKSDAEYLPNEIITLYDNELKPQALICAVPYLRDKDIRILGAGESNSDKSQKLMQGIKEYFHAIYTKALEQQKKYHEQGFNTIPILVMGHLFVAGGQTLADDGVRELYVGSLMQVGMDIFPQNIDYFALGHLHVAQKIQKQEHIRYSGSPIPMGFGEAKQEKQVVLIDFSKQEKHISTVNIPCFQELVRIKGDIEDIKQGIMNLKEKESKAWLEIIYTGKSLQVNLREDIEKFIENSQLEVRRIQNTMVFDKILQQGVVEQNLEDLTVMDIFQRCLDRYEILDEDRAELLESYQEIIRSLENTE